MKAKKVYEFINPKTDKYELEDTLPLGPNVQLKKEIEDWAEKYLTYLDISWKVTNNLDLIVEGPFDFSFVPSIYQPETLPIGLKKLIVQGYLIYDNLFKTNIPEYIETNDIYLDRFKRTHLPDNLKVNNSLIIVERNIENLPSNNLTVKGYLEINDVPLLTELPKTLKISSSISLKNLRIKKITYENWVVYGDLKLDNLKYFHSLPENLTVKGKLFINECPELYKLPENLTVNSVVIYRSGIKSLPKSMKILADEIFPKNFPVK